MEDRLVNFLANDLISDGGQWDMVVNILEVGALSLFEPNVSPVWYHRLMVLFLNPYTLIRCILVHPVPSILS